MAPCSSDAPGYDDCVLHHCFDRPWIRKLHSFLRAMLSLPAGAIGQARASASIHVGEADNGLFSPMAAGCAGTSDASAPTEGAHGAAARSGCTLVQPAWCGRGASAAVKPAAGIFLQLPDASSPVLTDILYCAGKVICMKRYLIPLDRLVKDAYNTNQGMLLGCSDSVAAFPHISKNGARVYSSAMSCPRSNAPGDDKCRRQGTYLL